MNTILIQAIGKEVKLKGNNIKLEASKGITAEGKQIAAEGDKVMGFDIHQMIVPSGPGTAVVPLPHPFIGKLADKLSDDVKIKGHNAAVKGSVAKHDDPVHNQLPGTIQFQQNPKKEGEVTGGTSGKVKINGKEAAVVGSTVTTCNDMGARDNSTVLAIGASIPMPVIINPKNTEEYLLEREKEKKINPEITSVKWNKTSVKEGEKAELTAQVKDIEDGNMLTFQVWKEGQDPAVNIPYARITKEIKGGQAKAELSYSHPGNMELPDKDMKFFMTVHSAWCPFAKSECVEIKLRRPEIKEAKWQDGEGKETDKGLAGEELGMEASCNEDMEEGAGVTFRVYKEGADTKRDKPVHEAGSRNEGGKAKTEWTYHYEHDPENPLTEKPKFFFTVNAQRCKEAKSGNLEISANCEIVVIDDINKTMGNFKLKLTMGGKTEEIQTDADGLYKMEEINISFPTSVNTEAKKTVIRIYGWRDSEMYKCKREDLEMTRFNVMPKSGFLSLNKRFEFEIDGKTYKLIYKGHSYINHSNRILKYEVLLDMDGRLDIGGGKYLIGRETYIMECVQVDWNSTQESVSPMLWAHRVEDSHEWYAFKEDIDECCSVPFERIKREKTNSWENEGNTYTYRVYKTRPRCIYTLNFTMQRLEKLRCENPFEEDFVFRYTEGIKVARESLVRFKAGSEYYFIRREDAVRAYLKNNINNSGNTGILQYHALSLPFFTLLEACDNSLKCDIDSLKEGINGDISLNDMYSGFVYSHANRGIYEGLNRLIIKCRSIWEYRKNIDIADYGNSNSMTEDRRDRQEEYIRNQLWMTEEVKKAMEVTVNEFYYFHPINFLKYVCSEFKGINVDRLKKVQDMVVSLKCLEKGADGMYGNAPKESTFCNHAVFLTILATDGNYRNFTNRDNTLFPELSTKSERDEYEREHGIKSSNFWCDELERLTREGRLVRLSPPEAQRFGNMGYTVIASYKAHDIGAFLESPHFATVRPGVNYDNTNGPMVANVGAKNDVGRASSFFSKEMYDAMKWYYNPMQEFRIDTRWIENLKDKYG